MDLLSLDLLQGDSSDHQDQTLCARVQQVQDCFLCMSHLPCPEADGLLGGDPEDGEGRGGGNQEEASYLVEVSGTLGLLVLETCSLGVLEALGDLVGDLVGVLYDLSPM